MLKPVSFLPNHSARDPLIPKRNLQTGHNLAQKRVSIFLKALLRVETSLKSKYVCENEYSPVYKQRYECKRPSTWVDRSKQRRPMGFTVLMNPQTKNGRHFSNMPISMKYVRMDTFECLKLERKFWKNEPENRFAT